MELEERNLSCREFFGEKADGYDEVHLKLMGTKKDAIDALDNDIINVLDLGAGTGLELIYLFERFPNAKVTAIDITPEMLKKIKDREFSDRVEIICDDFFKVEFGVGYDAVISTSALHHFTMKDKYRLYKKIFDCLKKGGQFINSDRIVDTLEQEEELYSFFLEYFNECHCDTPLCVANERRVLLDTGFNDVNFIDSKLSGDYKLLKCRK